MKSIRTSCATLIVTLALASCNHETDREGSLSETHPKLQKQLARDTVSQPITDRDNPALYDSYRITMEKYHNSGNYDVSDMYRGRLSPLDEKSHSEAKTYRNALNEGLKEGVNFAGKYTVVTVGCGGSCQIHYVVNREDGKVLDRLRSSVGAKYSPKSRLFVVNPPDSSINYQECKSCSPVVYVFENGKFKKLTAK
jgi:hypothetical protein